MAQHWKVTGGHHGGIKVREGEDLHSKETSQRLGHDALVKELELTGQPGHHRLHFEKVSGDGPSSGWVSLELHGQMLLEKTPAPTAARPPPAPVAKHTAVFQAGAYGFPDLNTLPDELPGGEVQLTNGMFDPAGLSTEHDATENEKQKSSENAMGKVVFEAVLEKVVPELFGVVTWAGAKGPSARGGGKQDIYKVVPLSESNAGPGAQKVFMHKDETQALGDKPAESVKKDQVVMQRKEFGWKKIYHALLGPTGNADNGGFMTEIPFTPTPMRMYTDHRVMGVIVLPGVSHISLMASTGLVAFAQRDGSYGTDEQAIVKDVLFERPYVVHDGLMVNDPARYVPHPSGMGTPMPGEDPKGVIVYCRATNVSRERGGQKR